MSNTKIERLNQTRQGYSFDTVSASLNIYTGQLTVSHADMSIGAGNFQIGVSHVYREDLKDLEYTINKAQADEETIKVGFSNGWKLNLQQYVFAYDEAYGFAGFNAGDYVYIDASGYKHRFIRYKDGQYGAFYDADGGLRLKITDSGYEIFDDVENKSVFDAKGRLIQIVSGINEAITKVIGYGQLPHPVCVYDQRKPSRRLELSYSADNVLTQIKCNQHDNTIKYSYDNSGRLMYVKLNNGSTANHFAAYIYDENGRIKCAYNPKNNEAMGFEYDQVTGECTKVTTGVITTIANGEEVYEIPQSQTKSAFTFTYAQDGETTLVTNEKGIALEHSFDLNGYTTGVLEKVSSNQYRTVTKMGGWSLSSSTNEDYFINGKNAIKFDGVNFLKAITPIESIRDLFGWHDNGADKIHKYTDQFILSFWLKCPKDVDGTKTARLSMVSDMTFGEETLHFDVKMKGIKANGWRYVTIPVDFAHPTGAYYGYDYKDYVCEFKENLLEATLSIDGVGEEGKSIYVADLRLDVGNAERIMIGDKDAEKITKVWYEDENLECHELSVNGGVYMSESDMFTTCKNKFLSLSGVYDFVCCDGTKVFSAISGGLVIDGASVELAADENGLCNFYTTTVTRLSKDKWCNAKRQNRICLSYPVVYYEQKVSTAIGEYDSFEGASSKFIWTNSDGSPRATKDEYEVINHNYYDDCGNIVRQVRYNFLETDSLGNATGEVIEKTFDYDTDEALTEALADAADEDVESLTKEYVKLRECIVATTENGVTETISYTEGPFLQISGVQTGSGLPLSMDYSEDGTKLLQASQGVRVGSADNTIRNVLGYNQKGYLSNLSDQAGREYDFIYNSLGEVASYKVNGTVVLEKSVRRSTTGDCNDVVTQRRFRSDTPDESVTTIDRYGRVESVNNGTMATYYTYQDNYSTFNESPLAAKISEIDDPYSNEVYTYQYNDNNEACGYTVKNGNTMAEKLKVEQVSNGETHYTHGDVLRKSVITYDDSLSENAKYIEPRINKTRDADEEFEGNFSKESDFVYNYAYDSLGRLEKVQTEVYATGHPSNCVRHESRYAYEEGTTRINSKIDDFIMYSASFSDGVIENILVSQYDYDDKGNVVGISEEGDICNNKSTDTVFHVERSTSYAYDQNNRLTEEVNSEFGSLKYVYDNVTGNLRKVQKKNAATDQYEDLKVFTYTKGKRTGVNGKAVTYDRFGNVVSEDGDITREYTYNDRNLLSNVLISSPVATYALSCQSFYNHQGVRYKKIYTNGTEALTTRYYLDGSKILGEFIYDEATGRGKELKYYYNAQGICGISHGGQNYRLIKDIFGNVTKIMWNHCTLAEYVYDAWGNCKILWNADRDSAQERDVFVVENNPFLWKGHYYDRETDLYYVGGRFYSPALMQYLDADDPENLISSANVPNSLDRNAITLDNSISFAPNPHTVFPMGDLKPQDPVDENADKTWWQVNWRKAVQWMAFALVLTASVVLACIPGTQALGIGMLMAGAKAAVSGFIAGAIIGGIISAIAGQGFWQGVIEGAVYGAIGGFTTGAIMGLVQGLATMKAVGACNTPAITDGDIPESYSEDFLNWLNKGEHDHFVYEAHVGKKSVYTGITKQTLKRRLYQHQYSGKPFTNLVAVHKNMTKNQARALETYRIINLKANKYNKILSISEKNKYYEEAMRWANKNIWRYIL